MTSELPNGMYDSINSIVIYAKHNIEKNFDTNKGISYDINLDDMLGIGDYLKLCEMARTNASARIGLQNLKIIYELTKT